MCGRATWGRGCQLADAHGDRTTSDLLANPETPLTTIMKLLPLFRRDDIVALANRRPHSYYTREAAIKALDWYWYAEEVHATGGHPDKHQDPIEHARITEPARAVLAIEDLEGPELVQLAAQLAHHSRHYYLLAELETLCDHPLFGPAAAYQVVEYAGRVKWDDHPPTPVDDIVDLLDARGYPARVIVDLMHHFRVGRMPRLFDDIVATPGIARVLESLQDVWSGKLSELVALARTVLDTPASAA